ncbi:MAG: hypothetical protein ACPLQO_13630 [Desulfotomaculales bacterium]
MQQVERYARIERDRVAALLDELDELNFRMASLSSRVAAFERLASEVFQIPGKVAAGCKGAYDPKLKQLYLYIPAAPPYLRVAWNRWPSSTNYREVRELWQGYVREALKGLNLPVEPLEKATVVFKFTWGDSRTHDVDNYAIKFMIDALVRNGVLKGDGCEEVSLVVFGEKSSDVWSTEVLVVPDHGPLQVFKDGLGMWQNARKEMTNMGTAVAPERS